MTFKQMVPSSTHTLPFPTLKHHFWSHVHAYTQAHTHTHTQPQSRSRVYSIPLCLYHFRFVRNGLHTAEYEQKDMQV